MAAIRAAAAAAAAAAIDSSIAAAAFDTDRSPGIRLSATAATAADAAAASADTTTSPMIGNSGEDRSERGTLEHLSGIFVQFLKICSVGSQMFFALSPIAAYLPQYLAMQERLSQSGAAGANTGSGSRSSSTGSVLAERGRTTRSNSVGGLSSSNILHRREARSRSPSTTSSGGLSISTSGGTLRETYGGIQSPSIAANLGNYCSSGKDGDSISVMGTGSPVNSNNHGANSSSGEGGGMSPLSILILLMSHLLRLVYFYGLHIWYPFNQKNNQSLDESSAAGMVIENEEIQYELIVQSIVMVSVQLLLCNCLARSRMITAKRLLHDHDHNDTSRLFGFGSIRQTLTSYRSSGESGKRSTKFILLGLFCIRCAATKLTSLLYPRRVWRYKTLREHIELLVLFLVSVVFYCRLWLFPGRGFDGINRIRDVSVLLESCLALPQVIQNYARKDTIGLSVVMVTGWIVGDFMKLVYFLIQSRTGWGGEGGSNTASEAAVAAAVAGAAVPGGASASTTPGGAAMQIFAGGCIVALVLDLFVLLQIVLWYPTPKMVAWRARVVETWSRFKPNNAVGRKRAVAREMMRLVLSGDQK